MKKPVSLLLCFVLILPLFGCTKKEAAFPVVRCVDNEITVNGEFIATSESFAVVRMDANVICLLTDSGYINLDGEGNIIELKDVITDPDIYEASISGKVDSLRHAIVARDSVIEHKIDHDKMHEAMSSYDDAVKMPFLIGAEAVHIIYKDDEGYAESVSFGFEEDGINKAYGPSDGLTCSKWMTGRVGYGIEGLMPDEYADHWAEDSLEIVYPDGQIYYWFCIAYMDEEGSKTYYSAIAKKDGDTRKLIYLEPVPGSFYCCDIEQFEGILEGL